MRAGGRNLGRIVLLLCIAATGGYCWSEEGPPDKASGTAGQQGFSYADYAAVLKAYVNVEGLVDYKSLKADRMRLDRFNASSAKHPRAAYEEWTENEKIAFWINAYNSLTLQAIIDHYPIEASFIGSFRFPDDSIRQIPGVWDKLEFKAMGRPMTLDEIEHETLRVEFNEPRIHLALVCASMSCAVLRTEPYTGERLSAQLDEQTRRFLQRPKNFRIDRDNNRVHLSSLFKWYGKDFVKTYGTDTGYEGHDRIERAVLNFSSNYLGDSDRSYLRDRRYGIKYLDYDWSLNEQRERR